MPTMSCKKKPAQSDSVEVDLHDADVTNDVQAFVARRATWPDPHFISGDTFTEGTVTMTISPGDTITESVTADPSSSSVTIDDQTTTVSQTATFAGFTAAQAGVGLDCNLKGKACKPPVPKFGTVSFSNATVNGVAFGSEDPTGIPAEARDNLGSDLRRYRLHRHLQLSCTRFY